MSLVLFWLSWKLETCSMTGPCYGSLLSFSPHHPTTRCHCLLQQQVFTWTWPLDARYHHFVHMHNVVGSWCSGDSAPLLETRPVKSQFCYQFLPPCSVLSFWVAIHSVLEFREQLLEWNAGGKMHLLLRSMYVWLPGSSSFYLRFWTIKFVLPWCSV